jgi:hypothetical protein
MTTVESLFVGDDRLFGVEIVFKDGKTDYIDPVENGGVSESNDEYFVCNGAFTYPYKKADVADLRRVKICQSCYYEVENCHCNIEGVGNDNS